MGVGVGVGGGGGSEIDRDTHARNVHILCVCFLSQIFSFTHATSFTASMRTHSSCPPCPPASPPGDAGGRHVRARGDATAARRFARPQLCARLYGHPGMYHCTYSRSASFCIFDAVVHDSLPSCGACTHTHTISISHTYAHTQSHTHTCTHTHMRTHAHTHTNTRAHAGRRERPRQGAGERGQADARFV
jgi:hypothetical protein